MNLRPSNLKYILIGAALFIATGGLWLKFNLGRASVIKETYLRIPKRTSLNSLIMQLQEKKMITNTSAFWLYATFFKRLKNIAPGTYKFQPHPNASQVIDSFRNPLKQMVQIPEGWWILRVAKKLEAKGVCTAKEYIELTQQPQSFQKKVSFSLPRNVSLEGYLYPDTYDLPPQLGAYKTISRQLKGFEKNILPLVPPHTDLHRVLTIASIVELEASSYKERAMVAGVIENRLKKRMKLQLCPTALYSMQEWKVLQPGETAKPDSPYNTYKYHGLPPGPISSPSIESVKAALNPAAHPYFFFVVRPEGGHHYSATFSEHIKHIRRLRQNQSHQKNSS